jgi:small multidrug resistance pump
MDADQGGILAAGPDGVCPGSQTETPCLPYRAAWSRFGGLPIARADGVPDMTPNTAYIYLSVAIISEVIGTLALKSSDGFSKVYPSVTVLAAYAVAFFFLSLTLRTVPVGIAYAIWAGAGTALIVLVSAVLLKQSLDAAALIGIPLIVAGIVIINLGSHAAAH